MKKKDEAKLIYVPGGTDAAFLYGNGEGDDKAPDKDHAGKAINLHKDIYKLGKDLIVAGLGGSVPAILYDYEDNI